MMERISQKTRLYWKEFVKAPPPKGLYWKIFAGRLHRDFLANPKRETPRNPGGIPDI
jgi:hypothetical protein